MWNITAHQKWYNSQLQKQGERNETWGRI
jgi:hypothetical protein